MKNKKRELLPYSLYDYDAYARHFAKMARRGWMVEGTAPYTWVYRRCEPRELTFAVSYFARASAFDPEPGEEQREFIDFCERTGWRLAATNAQMQVFYNERPDPVPIETDPALEVESIHRAVKKVYLPFIVFFMAMSVLVLATNTQLKHFSEFPLTFLAHGSTLVSSAAELLLLLYGAVELAAYFLWLRRARRAARETGELIPSAGHRRFQIAVLTLMLALFAAFPAFSLLYGGGRYGLGVVVMLVIMCVAVAVTWAVRKLMIRRKMPRTATMLATFGTAVALSVTIVTGTVFAAVNSLSSGLLQEDADNIPLTFTDLYEGTDYRESIRRDGSPFLTYLSVLQYELAGDSLDYVLYEVKIPFLEDPVRNLVLRGLEKDGTMEGLPFAKADPAPWGADVAFRELWAGEPQNDWLLFYKGRIVFLDMDTQPTQELMTTVAEKLGGKER